jgi:hypothetical protein
MLLFFYIVMFLIQITVCWLILSHLCSDLSIFNRLDVAGRISFLTFPFSVIDRIKTYASENSEKFSDYFRLVSPLLTGAYGNLPPTLGARGTMQGGLSSQVLPLCTFAFTTYPIDRPILYQTTREDGRKASRYRPSKFWSDGCYITKGMPHLFNWKSEDLIPLMLTLTS